MTALATYSGAGPLHVEFDRTLQLGRDETLAFGLRRVSMEQFESGAAGFFEGEEVFLDAVHEARKAIKRVRALLRLIRGELSDRVYGYEDVVLRDTGRMLAPTRAAVAVVGAGELIRDLFGDLLAEGTFSEMLRRLARRRELTRIAAMEDPKMVVRVVRNLEKAHRRYASWPTDAEAREVYGMGVRDEYGAIASGLASTYARGRREMVIAYSNSTDRNLHEWRKRVKYLRHQMEFLATLWPDVIMGMAVTLDRLGVLLGEDHDLAELAGLVRERPDLCPNPRERSLLHALIAQRRSELRTAAEVLGRRVYAEKPSALGSRFGEYWESRRLAIGASFDTLMVL
ncbi:MAG: CHAD domain-containing protein [Actinobacteria bacterium]|nr:CHAD domain-containing protein [Actinomycetota bacterium]